MLWRRSKTTKNSIKKKLSTYFFGLQLNNTISIIVLYCFTAYRKPQRTEVDEGVKVTFLYNKGNFFILYFFYPVDNFFKMPFPRSFITIVNANKM